MTREAKKITIRNGEVFFPDDGRMEDVSIFRSVVICDCKKDDYDSLVTFLDARSPTYIFDGTKLRV